MISDMFVRAVVAEFVASCRRHDILPCFYMAPPHMGNLMLEGLSPDEYMARVNGMLSELLTNYGTIHVRPQPSPTPSPCMPCALRCPSSTPL